jgi:hypothetical protein
MTMEHTAQVSSFMDAANGSAQAARAAEQTVRATQFKKDLSDKLGAWATTIALAFRAAYVLAAADYLRLVYYAEVDRTMRSHLKAAFHVLEGIHDRTVGVAWYQSSVPFRVRSRTQLSALENLRVSTNSLSEVLDARIGKRLDTLIDQGVTQIKLTQASIEILALGKGLSMEDPPKPAEPVTEEPKAEQPEATDRDVPHTMQAQVAKLHAVV